MIARRLLIGLAVAGILIAARTAWADAGPECQAPPELLAVGPKMPQLAARLLHKQAVTIVATGGNSTKGGAAGSADLAYPERLQVALTALFPGVPINVINQGAPRQSARQMAERIAAEVLPTNPTAVVWETGTTDAVRGIDIDEFAAALQAGIEELKGHGVDVILVDMQFSPRTTSLINFENYLKAMRRVADLNDVYLFPRFELMRYWSEQGVFNFDNVADADRAKLAAAVYDCLGRNLAQAIKLSVD